MAGWQFCTSIRVPYPSGLSNCMSAATFSNCGKTLKPGDTAAAWINTRRSSRGSAPADGKNSLGCEFVTAHNGQSAAKLPFLPCVAGRRRRFTDCKGRGVSAQNGGRLRDSRSPAKAVFRGGRCPRRRLPESHGSPHEGWVVSQISKTNTNVP